MAGVHRWLAIIAVVLLSSAVPVLAGEEDAPPAPTTTAPPDIKEDIARLLELGKLLMGRNNPAYAPAPIDLPFEERNRAGEQALSTFQEVVKREPKLAQGWLWLGIAYTCQLRYEKKTPRGKPLRTEAFVNAGIDAFRKAYACDSAGEDCVKYYGDALMEFRKDFDAALKLWQDYLAVAKTDLQRMLALVQAARACLNKAHAGKEAKEPAERVRQCYQDAVGYLEQAAALFPKARDVNEMRALLARYQYLGGQ